MTVWISQGDATHALHIACGIDCGIACSMACSMACGMTGDCTFGMCKVCVVILMLR
jgi:hypothetical protein